MLGRQLSDEALLHQLAAFLAYEHRHGRLCLAEWMDTKDFAWADRTFLECAYLGATAMPHLTSYRCG